MDSLFLDTDILIDVLAKREPFYNSAAAILSLAERNLIKCSTPPLVIANINYIISKIRSKQFAKQSIHRFKSYVSIAALDQKIVDRALGSKFVDLEDAIQNYAALRCGADVIITRNKKDYAKSELPVLTAAEYVKLRESKNKIRKK